MKTGNAIWYRTLTGEFLSNFDALRIFVRKYPHWSPFKRRLLLALIYFLCGLYGPRLRRLFGYYCAVLLILVLAGCQSGFSVNRVQHEHPLTRAQGERVLAEWRNSGPACIVLRAGGVTRSMGATVVPGDWLLCTQYNGGAVPVGVFVVFKDPSAATGLTCHRALADSGTAVFTSGDANARSDGWIAHERVVALVWRVVHFPHE